jgi:hypothetical protein
MSTNDVIIIGPYKYTVLKREGRRMLLSWIESTGIYKETWLLIKGGI